MSTGHPILTEKTLSNPKITKRSLLFFFFLGLSCRLLPTVRQKACSSIKPPNFLIEIKRQTPNVGKLQEILGS